MPETATLKVGSDATMGIFYEGKPLANAKCIIFNRGWQDLLMTKSGADGKVTFKVDQPGDYIVIKVSGFVEVFEINTRKKAIKGYPVESRLFTEDF